jgi:hypothetical protein
LRILADSYVQEISRSLLESWNSALLAKTGGPVPETKVPFAKAWGDVTRIESAFIQEFVLNTLILFRINTPEKRWEGYG